MGVTGVAHSDAEIAGNDGMEVKEARASDLDALFFAPREITRNFLLTEVSISVIVLDNDSFWIIILHINGGTLTPGIEAVSQFVIPAKPRKAGREAGSGIVWIH